MEKFGIYVKSNMVKHSVETSWFSYNLIFREINFKDFGGPKTAILTHFQAVIRGFYEFLHFLKAEMD